MSKASKIAIAGVLAAFAASSAPALANGRFPASNAVLFSPKDDATVFVRVTFGLLVTKDRGTSWQWICERAIGFSGPEDPSYVITKSGAIVVGLFDGLRVSRDGGCSWSAVKTEATVFVDVTERADGAIIALASSYDKRGDAGSLYKSQLFISTDDAKSFVPLGPKLDPTLLAESVEVAPGDSSHIYISVVRGDDVGRQGALLVSTDGAAHFTERAVRLENKELAPFIAAVDRKNAERIYVRTSAAPDGHTRLLVTENAGKTYRPLLAAKGPLLGFALSPDGMTVHAGGPDDGLFELSPDAADGGAAPTALSPLRVQCLARGGDALWACSSESGGFIAGSAALGDAGAPRFEARVHLRDIAGPLACAEGTAVANECTADWLKLEEELGIGSPASARPSADGGAAAPKEDLATRRSNGLWIAAVLGGLGLLVALLRSRRKR